MVRWLPSPSVKPSTISPGAVTKRCATMSAGSGASALTRSRLISSSQSKRYSRERPALPCTTCSIRARAAGSVSVKYAG